MARREGRRPRPGSAGVRPHPLIRPDRSAARDPIRRSNAKRTPQTKLFVLDTNVLMHDPTSLFRFEEHDIFLPMMTLEELDNNKKGMSEVARNARQASRFLDDIVSGCRARHRRRHRAVGTLARAWPTGRLFLQTEAINADLPAALPTAKGDNQILGVVMHLQQQVPQAPGHPGVQGHQHAHQGARPGPAGGGLLQRQGAGGHRPALHRHAANCRPTSGTATARTWSPGSRTAARSTASTARCASDCWSTSSSSWTDEKTSGRSTPSCASARRQERGAGNPQRLQPPQERRLGHHRAQPRAEFRPQPADESGHRLRHPARPGRHRQDPADAGRRPDADAGGQALQRDHHHPRHRAGGRGHRLPARHRGGEDDALDGRAGGQPRRAQRAPTRKAANGAAPPPAT